MFLLLFLLWIILLSNITLEIIIFGAAISTALLFFACKYMNYNLSKEKKLWKRLGKYLLYLGILIIEIIKANIAVVGIIVKNKPIEPAFFDFETDLNSTGRQVLLANSITLTPGTITAVLEDGKFVVHCIDKSMAVGIADSIFVRQLRELDEEKKAHD